MTLQETKAACDATDGAWMCNGFANPALPGPNPHCTTPSGRQVRTQTERPMQGCTWVNYQHCGLTFTNDGKICPNLPEGVQSCDQNCTGPHVPYECELCPGSVGNPTGVQSRALQENTFAINGDASWTPIYFKAHNEEPGYWTVPENPAWKDNKPPFGPYRAHAGGVGWFNDCRNKQVEVDIELTLCKVRQGPAPVPAPGPPAPVAPTPAPTPGLVPPSPGWKSYQNNCYTGHGCDAIIGSYTNPDKGIQDCEHYCIQNQACNAFVYGKGNYPGMCAIYKHCDPTGVQYGTCDPGSQGTTYVKG